MPQRETPGGDVHAAGRDRLTDVSAKLAELERADRRQREALREIAAHDQPDGAGHLADLARRALGDEDASDPATTTADDPRERVIASMERSLYAAWIDVVQHHSIARATEILSEALDGFDGPEWDGKETGLEWLERTRGEEDGQVFDSEDVPRCIRCGCTDEQACPGGCTWVPGSMDGDLCSRCAPAAEEPADGACGHECEQGGVGYRCERPAGHPIDGYGPKFRHAAGIDADLAEGTDEGDGFGTADLVTWGEDEIGGEQDVAVDWGTIEAYGTGKDGEHA